MPTALITGASRGLGLALADALADRGWTLLLDARDGDALAAAVAPLEQRTTVHALAGDVTDPTHWRALGDTVAGLAPIDLVVNNASALGPSPLPALLDLDLATFGRVLATNVVGPLAVLQAVAAHVTSDVVVVDVSSDAAVEAYPGWGGYGASKAALDHLTAVLAVEQPGWRVYALDPGDMRTAMHQAAFPDEDISDRPWPSEVVPAVLHLLDTRPASGRIRAADLLEEVAA